MGSLAFQLIVLASFAGFTYFLSKKMRVLTKMQQIDRLSGMVERFKNMFFIGVMQRKMIGGERKPGVMHAIIFWGFMIILVRKIQLFAIAFDEFFTYPALIDMLYSPIKDIVSFAVMCSVLYALYRRIVVKPGRLKDSENHLEPKLILLLIFSIMLTDFLYDGFKFAIVMGNGFADATLAQIQSLKHEMSYAPLGAIVATWFAGMDMETLHFCYNMFYWTQITIVFGFLVLIPSTEHLHVATALPTVFFRNLDRSDVYTTNKVPSLDLEALMDEDEDSEEEPVVGINTATDLTWKEGLDAFTCTECGRCKDSCPTWITDKPLAMQWVNNDIRDHLVENESKIMGELEDTEIGRLVGEVIKEDTLWACTTCGYCETACPVELEHLPRIFKMRQNMVMMETEFPEELQNVFDNYENQSNPWGIGANSRGDWAKEFDVPVVTDAEEMKNYEYLYYVGSPQSYDNRNQKVAKAMVDILRKANISFAILGAEEKSTGECVRRAGNEMLFQQMAEELVDSFKEVNVTKIITCDPHAYNTLKNEYPEFGGHFDVIHHTQLISELIETQKIEVSESFDNVIFHDPCYLGRHNGEFDAPRYVIDKITSDNVIEFDMNKEKSMCCGAGGGRMWMEETIGSRINETRVEQAMEKEPKVIATACPYCLIMMEEGTGNKGVQEKIDRKDIAELVADALV